MSGPDTTKSVTCNGCFDGFHAGHLVFLGFVRGVADYLGGRVVVGINDDAYIRDHKRPNPRTAEERKQALLQTGLVDDVLVFFGGDPSGVVRDVRPVVHVTGREYEGSAVEAGACRDVGARLMYVNRTGSWASSAGDTISMEKGDA